MHNITLLTPAGRIPETHFSLHYSSEGNKIPNQTKVKLKFEFSENAVPKVCLVYKLVSLSSLILSKGKVKSKKIMDE